MQAFCWEKPAMIEVWWLKKIIALDVARVKIIYIYIYVHTHIHVCIWYIVYNMYTQKIYYTIIVTTNFLGPLVPQF